MSRCEDMCGGVKDAFRRAYDTDRSFKQNVGDRAYKFSKAGFRVLGFVNAYHSLGSEVNGNFLEGYRGIVQVPATMLNLIKANGSLQGARGLSLEDVDMNQFVLNAQENIVERPLETLAIVLSTYYVTKFIPHLVKSSPSIWKRTKAFFKKGTRP